MHMAEEDTLSSDVDLLDNSSTGRGMHYLVVMSGGFLGEHYLIHHSQLIIGRDIDADISLADQTVSRRHAEINKSHGRVLLRDLSSRNGLFVNNLRVEEWVLRNGDLIRIGGTLLQFVDAESKMSFYVGKYPNKIFKKREHPRFSLIGLGDGYLPGEKGSVEILSIKDISRGGIAILTKNRIETGTEIQVAVYFKNKEKKMVAEGVMGSVLSSAERRGGSFMVNIRFHEAISEKNAPGLHTRLCELEQIS